jgi:hypothetical protein
VEDWRECVGGNGYDLAAGTLKRNEQKSDAPVEERGRMQYY